MLKIAVCDDGWTDIETLEKALDQFDRYLVDYDVFFSAEELLKYRKEHEENYNMYIFDIEMPGMSGLELAKEIRKEDAKALFVFLTGYTSYVMDVFEVVTFDFIKKPVTAGRVNMAAFFIQFFLNLLDIGIFWYYLNTFHNKKRVPAFVCMPLPVLLAAVWAWVNSFGYPFANLLALATVLSVLSLLFYGGLLQKVTGVIVFIEAGILVEPAGFILLQVLQYSPLDGEMYKYYFVAALGEIMRCGAIYLFCRAARLKGINFSKLLADFIWPVLVAFVFAVMDCCFIVMVSLKSGSAKSLVMCLCIIVSVMLTYYLVFYMVERLAGLFEKQHGGEMYKEEMRYQEIYYRELEKRNEDMQVFKHDLKNKLVEMYRFFEEEDIVIQPEKRNK